MKCDCCDKEWGDRGLQSIEKVEHHLWWTALKWQFEWKCHFHSDRSQRDCLIQMDKALLIYLGRIPHHYKELHNIQKGKLITWFKLILFVYLHSRFFVHERSTIYWNGYRKIWIKWERTFGTAIMTTFRITRLMNRKTPSISLHTTIFFLYMSSYLFILFFSLSSSLLLKSFWCSNNWKSNINFLFCSFKKKYN